MFGRWGGDEFSVLLMETSVQEALEISERIRIACNLVKIRKESGAEIKFTISLGVSESSQADENIDQIIARAGATMYKSKLAGENRVEVA
ncbi:MAG: GGDEF domain-containing protein [Candidatus Atribacteria bacterium]|nr:GGDEF domain-containing protein [Candidatus Atribacteria bacterium]